MSGPDKSQVTGQPAGGDVRTSLLWEAYRQAYLTYQMSIHQSEMVSNAALVILKDFPDQLPPSLRDAIAVAITTAARFHPDLQQLAERLRTATNKAMADEFSASGLSIEEYLDRHVSQVPKRFEGGAVIWCLAMAKLGISPVAADFEKAILSQRFAMSFAYLDAFLAESVRAACTVSPTLLMTDNKAVSWEDVISIGTWEGIVASMTEQLAYEFGMLPWRKRIQRLRERLKISVGSGEADITGLEEAENLRHIVIHNGGRASQEYLNKTSKPEIHLGDFVPIPPEYVEKITNLCMFIAADVYTGIATKYFGKKPSELDLNVGRTVAPG